MVGYIYDKANFRERVIVKYSWYKGIHYKIISIVMCV